MGAKSRRKGYRIEHELVELHRAAGIEARRVPLSGGVEGWEGDLRIQSALGELRAEVKARAGGEGFKVLERWLGDGDLLFLRRDRSAPLVVMGWCFYTRIMMGGK